METLETLLNGIGIILLSGIGIGLLLSAALFIWLFFNSPTDDDPEDKREASKYDHWNL